MTDLQIQAQKKLNKILMGNGGEYRQLRLYNIRDLLDKEHLTQADTLVLEHFLISDKATIDNTAYVANTAVYPMSWGHYTTVLTRKTAK